MIDQSMDFLPDKEFHRLFNRISEKVDLKGAGSPAEINERLNRKISEYRYEYGTHPLALLQAESRTSPLRKLMRAGFARRAIDEAIAEPVGEIALTLKFGRRRAKEILMKRKRRGWL